MRWLAVSLVALGLVLLWHLRPPLGGADSRASFSSRRPAALGAKIDLLMTLKDFKKLIIAQKFNLQSCGPTLEESLSKALDLRPGRFDFDKLKKESPQILDLLFDIKLALHARAKTFGTDLIRAENCLSSLRNMYRSIRLLEDTIGEHAAGYPDEDSDEEVSALSGKAPAMMVNPAFAPFELKTGDVLLSRGPAFVSAALARLSEVYSNFSHLDIVYIDPKSGKKWAIGSYIEVGAIARPLEDYLDDDKVRVLVFRFGNAEVAQRAAEGVFKKVNAYRAEKGEGIPYDFSMDMKDHGEMFNTELIADAFSSAAIGKSLKLPMFQSRIRLSSRDFLDRLGVKAERTFMPADLEVDPRFDLVAEWRDFSRVNRSHMKDAVLSAMYDWMDREKYVLKETSSIGIKKMVAWHLRRWPVFSSLMEKQFPANMSQAALGAVTSLNEAADAIYAHLESANEAHRKEKNVWLTPLEMASELEAYRREDLRRYESYQKTHDYDPLAKKPEFHLLFR